MQVQRLAFTAALLAAAGSAQAFDYWRLDLGYSMSTGADIRDKSFADDQVICGDADCNSAGKIKDVGNGYALSGGLGWRVAPDWRVDVTLAYRTGYGADETMPDGVNIKADVTSLSVMAAGYRDFSLSGWTGKPYVGLGLGYAQNEVDNVKYTFEGLNLQSPGGKKSGLAWAVMAGVGIPLSGGATLDIGYRYTDLGKLATDSGSITFGGVPLGTYGGAEGKLRAHELSIGMRF